MFKIFLDAGHGGTDPGAVRNGVREKDITLQMALAIGQGLADKYQVLYSRTTDTFISLAIRAQMANERGADFFLSLHCNAHTTPQPNGYEDFTNVGMRQQLLRFGEPIAQIWTRYGRQNRGAKIANFAVLRRTAMPAVLVENGFVSNVRDALLLRDPVFMRELVQAHVRAIENIKAGT